MFSHIILRKHEVFFLSDIACERVMGLTLRRTSGLTRKALWLTSYLVPTTTTYSIKRLLLERDVSHKNCFAAAPDRTDSWALLIGIESVVRSCHVNRLGETPSASLSFSKLREREGRCFHRLTWVTAMKEKSARSPKAKPMERVTLTFLSLGSLCDYTRHQPPIKDQEKGGWGRSVIVTGTDPTVECERCLPRYRDIFHST